MQSKLRDHLLWYGQKYLTTTNHDTFCNWPYSHADWKQLGLTCHTVSSEYLCWKGLNNTLRAAKRVVHVGTFNVVVTSSTSQYLERFDPSAMTRRSVHMHPTGTSRLSILFYGCMHMFLRWLWLLAHTSFDSLVPHIPLFCSVWHYWGWWCFTGSPVPSYLSTWPHLSLGPLSLVDRTAIQVVKTRCIWCLYRGYSSDMWHLAWWGITIMHACEASQWSYRGLMAWPNPFLGLSTVVLTALGSRSPPTKWADMRP